MPRLNGKFVSQATYDAAMKDKTAMTDNAGQEDNNMAIEEAKDYIPNNPDTEVNESLEDTEALDAACDRIIDEAEEELGLCVKYKHITTGEFIKMCDSLDFSFAAQRALVWDTERKDLLIDSKLSGYDCGSIYLWGNYVIDGKQRANLLTTVFKGLYTPSTLEGDYEDLNGKIFGAWDEDSINSFLSAPVQLIVLPSKWNEDEVAQQFLRTNNGRPLTPVQQFKGKTRPVASALSESVNHKLWDHKAENAQGENKSIYGKLGREGIEKIYFNLLHLQHGGDTLDFSEKNLVKWLMKWYTEDKPTSSVWGDVKMRTNKLNEVLTTLFRLDETRKAAKFFCKRTHLLSLLAVMDSKIDAEAAAGNMLVFYQLDKDKDEKRKYRALCDDKTSSVAGIMARRDFIKGLIYR